MLSSGKRRISTQYKTETFLGAAGCQSGRTPGDASEDGARGQSRSTRIIEAEDPADHFARSIEARNGLQIQIHHLRCVWNNAEPAKGEGDPASHLISLKRRLIDFERPV